MEDYINVLNFQPHKLSKSILADPNSGIRDFFSFHPLPEARQNIHSMFRAWLRLVNVFAEPSDVSAMILFYEQLIEFVEISYVKGIQDEYLPTPINQPKE